MEDKYEPAPLPLKEAPKKYGDNLRSFTYKALNDFSRFLANVINWVLGLWEQGNASHLQVR